MQVKIYRPARNAMQSGVANSQRWVLEPVATQNARFVEPLMGWTSSSDTTQQLRLKFNTSEEAIAFAKQNGWEYQVQKPNTSILKPKSYASNFG
ncbi:MAG: ETC complex I subunit [Hyphomicrobiales bacterium]|nr:ETC complex I subunit [Hyphomicrobiales bacterium]